VWKWPVVKDKHIKIKPTICVLFVFDLDGKCKFIKKQNIIVIKEICSWLPPCLDHWMNRRRFCLQKGDVSQYLINCAFLSFFWGCQKWPVIAILKTPVGSISFNSWLRCYRTALYRIVSAG